MHEQLPYKNHKGEVGSHKRVHKEYVLKTEKDRRLGTAEQSTKFCPMKDAQIYNSPKASDCE